MRTGQSQLTVRWVKILWLKWRHHRACQDLVAIETAWRALGYSRPPYTVKYLRVLATEQRRRERLRKAQRASNLELD